MLCGFTYDFVSVTQSVRVLQKHREEALLVVQKVRAMERYSGVRACECRRSYWLCRCWWCRRRVRPNAILVCACKRPSE